MNTPPRMVLDLFCGEGGVTEGLRQAWPDAEITGVEINANKLKRYPGHHHIHGDVMEWLEWGDFMRLFDFIWASPPCQKYSAATRHLSKPTPRLIPQLREKLLAIGKPFCIENTPGAPLINPVTLCGLSFGLNVKRHRLFETNFPVAPVPCVPGHPGNWYVIFGHEVRDRRHGHKAGRKNKLEKGREAMDIDWMTRGGLSEAIPPAYSRYIAEQFLAAPVMEQ